MGGLIHLANFLFGKIIEMLTNLCESFPRKSRFFIKLITVCNRIKNLLFDLF